jgi:hypothetical protein
MDDLELVTRMLVRAQKDSLARAERLRKLALAVARSRRQNPGNFLAAGQVAISASKLAALEKLVAGLSPFHTPPKRTRKS